MLVKFKRPVQFGSVDYKVGTHEVPDQFLNNWFFEACVKSNYIEVVSVPKKYPPKEDVLEEVQEETEAQLSNEFVLEEEKSKKSKGKKQNSKGE